MHEHVNARFTSKALGLVMLATALVAGCDDSSDDNGANDSGGTGPTPLTPLNNANLRERTALDESYGSFAGMRTSIAVDSAGQAHVVTDHGGIGDGRPLTIFHRSGTNSWSAGELPIPDAQADLVYGPLIKIDGNNRAWIAAHFFTGGNYDNSGQGLWTIDNVVANTNLRWFGLKHFGPWGGWLNPILALDGFRPDQVVVFTGDGVYTVVNSGNAVTAESQLHIGQTGEQGCYDIGQRTGQVGIVHACQSGSAPDQAPHNPASYMNSTMAGPVVFASTGAYDQNNEQAHPGLAADLANPATAYFACVWNRGLVMNIWNATRNGGQGGLVRAADDLITLDPSAANPWRMNTTLAAAVGGGCWAVWGVGDQVKLVFVTADGNVGETLNVANGAYPNLCVDRFGNVHLAFASGGRMRYMKLRMSTGG